MRDRLIRSHELHTTEHLFDLLTVMVIQNNRNEAGLRLDLIAYLLAYRIRDDEALKRRLYSIIDAS